MDHNHDVKKLGLLLVSYTAVAFVLLGITVVFSMINVSYAQKAVNLVSNPNFTSNSSNKTMVPWTDPFKNCQKAFSCTINSTTGWKDNTSLQISTNQSTKNAISSIRGNQIAVTPGQSYQLTTHMKLNQYATRSHVAIEAYNQTSNKWTQIAQCPIGTNGPLEWHEYSCEITIPANIMKIRPVLYPGWSSQVGKEAVTLFDDISIIKTGTR